MVAALNIITEKYQNVMWCDKDFSACENMRIYAKICENGYLASLPNNFCCTNPNDIVALHKQKVLFVPVSAERLDSMSGKSSQSKSQ